jgi:hypothetical protein
VAWRAFSGLMALGALVLAVMFSLVVLGLLLGLGLIFSGWWWWKTRALRRVLREQRAAAHSATRPVQGVVIEGEVVREASDVPRLPR